MSYQRKIIVCIAVFISLSGVIASATDQQSLEKLLNDAYDGKILQLKIADASDQLHFDENGNSLDQVKEGPWTSSGLLKVDNVFVKDNEIQFKTERVIVALRKTANHLEPFLIPTDEIALLYSRLHPNAANDKQLLNSLSKIFVGGSLDDAMLGSWKSDADFADINLRNGQKELKSHLKDGIMGYLSGDRPVYAGGSGLTPPKPSYDPIPDFPDPPRQVKTDAIRVVGLIVNEKGQAELPCLLNTNAGKAEINMLAAVAHWRFRPARKQNQPVATFVAIQMDLPPH